MAEGQYGSVNAKEAFGVLYSSIGSANHPGLHDATLESDGTEIILTTDDGVDLQTWVLPLDALRETDPPTANPRRPNPPVTLGQGLVAAGLAGIAVATIVAGSRLGRQG